VKREYGLNSSTARSLAFCDGKVLAAAVAGQVKKTPAATIDLVVLILAPGSIKVAKKGFGSLGAIKWPKRERLQCRTGHEPAGTLFILDISSWDRGPVGARMRLAFKLFGQCRRSSYEGLKKAI
jgi:hypothetical protein